MSILLLNYAHPLTEEQLGQVSALLGETPEVRFISTQVDRDISLAQVAGDLATATGLLPAEWQTRRLVVNPPSLAPVALALLAEIHGRCSYFPPILNIRPVLDALPPRYEVAEIVNLQAVRDTARHRR